MKLRKDMIAQNLLPLPLVEMFTTDGDLDLEDQDHLKYVILKIKIRSPNQRDLEDISTKGKGSRSRSDLEDQDHAHL